MGRGSRAWAAPGPHQDPDLGLCFSLPSAPTLHPTDGRPFKAQIIKVPVSEEPASRAAGCHSANINSSSTDQGPKLGGSGDTCEVKQVRLPSLLLFLLGFAGTLRHSVLFKSLQGLPTNVKRKSTLLTENTLCPQLSDFRIMFLLIHCHSPPGTLQFTLADLPTSLQHCYTKNDSIHKWCQHMTIVTAFPTTASESRFSTRIWNTGLGPWPETGDA